MKSGDLKVAIDKTFAFLPIQSGVRIEILVLMLGPMIRLNQAIQLFFLIQRAFKWADGIVFITLLT